MVGLLGLAITMICVLIYYRLPGLVANLALIVNLILLIGALTMFRFVLTLPGIAGIILTIGLSVDASVLIYERLREEMALGKTLRVALETAYDKAFSSIFDANVTHDAGAFDEWTVPNVVHQMLGVQDAAVHRLEPVPRVGQGPGDDHAHGVVHERGGHLLLDRDRRQVLRGGGRVRHRKVWIRTIIER